MEEVYNFVIDKDGKIIKDTMYEIPPEIRLDIYDIVEKGKISPKRELDNKPDGEEEVAVPHKWEFTEWDDNRKKDVYDTFC